MLIALCACNREAIGDYPAANANDCLPAVNLIDQHGKTVSLASLKGKPVLIDFIYASCAATCPLLTEKMTAIARELGGESNARVTLVSLTLDPEHDTPAAFATYAATHGANRKDWLFLTGSPANIDRVLALFKLRRMRESDGTIMHSVSAFLLAPDGHQVRQYNALDVSPKSVAADIDHVDRAG
jgi:protein SCO1/2